MMLNYFQKFDGEVKTLQLKKNPLYFGTGWYEDINGVKWDIRCVIGGDKPYVTARLVDNNNPYYSTSSDGNSYGFHRWNPYFFEIIK